MTQLMLKDALKTLNPNVPYNKACYVYLMSFLDPLHKAQDD